MRELPWSALTVRLLGSRMLVRYPDGSTYFGVFEGYHDTVHLGMPVKTIFLSPKWAISWQADKEPPRIFIDE